MQARRRAAPGVRQPGPTPIRGAFAVHPWRDFCVCAAVLVALLYGRGWNAPFVYDDLDQIVNNPNLRGWSDFAHRFLLQPVHLTSSLLSHAGTVYRPLFWVSLFVDHGVWGLNPAGYHLTSVALHYANGCLAFALLRRLGVPARVAAAAGLLWLGLPVNTEAVAWISGRAYLLCAAFVLLALLGAVGFVERGRWWRAAATGLAAAGAVLSHELGVMVLPLLLAGLFWTRAERRRRLLLLLAPVACAALLVAGWRAHLGVDAWPGFGSVRWMLLALAEYLRLLALPLHMSVERSTTMTQGRFSLADVAALGVFAMAWVYAIARRRGGGWLLAAVGWFTVCIAPFCLVQNYQGLAERFDYLAGLGFALALVVLCAGATRPALRRTVLAVAGLWCAWNLGRTWLRVGDWTDPVRLYASSLEATPASASLHYNLAFSYRERGDLAEALEEYRRVLALDPRFPNGYASLGDVYLKQDRYAEAQAAYGRALALAPDDPAVLLNSGAAYQNAGDVAAAERAYRRVLALDPKSSAAHVNLGVLYVAEQRTDEAMHQFAMAIDLKTRDIVPYYDLGAIFQQAGRPDLAMVLYRKVLEIKPDDEETLRNMRIIAAK